MNCLIVDDQDVFREVLKRLMELDPTLVLVGECTDAYSAHKLLTNTDVDLIFLDIKMPGMSGMELARILENRHPLIVFTTSDQSHAIEAFELNVADFLLKPISPARFLKTIKKVKEIMESRKGDIEATDFVLIRDSNVIRKLLIKDILYIEAVGDYIRVAQKNQDYFINSSLKLLEQKLPKNIFFRVHRSFIINMIHVDCIEGKTLKIDKHLIPISSTYKSYFNKQMPFI